MRHAGRLLLSVVTFAILVLVTAPSARAAWPHDALNGNVVVSAATSDQTAANAVSDGAGGAIFVWIDGRASITHIFAQRVSAAGVPLWTTDGVQLCSASGNEYAPAVLADGSGGAIVAWQDARGSFYDIYAQRISASGAIQWAAAGQPVSLAANNQTAPKLVSDGAGGAIVAWADVRNGATQDVYAQRLNGSGTPQWTTDGVPICQAANNQNGVVIASDGAGGAIVAWTDARNGTTNTDIYAQRVNASGTVQWPTDGVFVCAAANNQNEPQIVPDGSGGAILAWQDLRGADADVYAQRVNASGGAMWAVNGVALVATTGAQSNPVIAPDGEGGAIVAWQDFRAGSYSDIFAQRVNGAGSALWTAGGVALGPVAFAQTYPAIASDGAGGAFVAWTDARNGAATDIFAQRVSATGQSTWASTGLAVSTAAGTQEVPAIIRDTAGGAILAWEDLRSGASYDLYAQRLDPFGYLGNPEPVLASVNDVPNDQGGRVKLAWYASYLDGLSDPNLAAYDIYRSAPGSVALAAARAGAHVATSFAGTPVPGGRSFVIVPDRAQLYAWEFVATVAPAHFLSAYGSIASTTGDSTAAGNPPTIFMVVGRNAGGSMYWLSAPDSGYSVDNLPPLAPAPFTGAYSAGASRLHWGANTEADLAGYRLYRGSSSSFVPGPGNLVVAQPDTGYADVGPAGSFYRLSAVDVHGNESGFALLTPAGTTDVGTPSAHALALALASPNPGRGESALRYSLPRPGEARLAVFDLLGREVRVLASGPAGAGERVARWDGRDASGRPVGDGVYLVRLSAQGRDLAVRLVRLR